MVGIAGNKCDLYDKEQVTEEEVKKFAEEINALFRLTSAFENQGIDELFKCVGSRYLDPAWQDIIKPAGNTGGSGKVVLTGGQKTKDKKGCCKN